VWLCERAFQVLNEALAIASFLGRRLRPDLDDAAQAHSLAVASKCHIDVSVPIGDM
jgi:hypothetical protein